MNVLDSACPFSDRRSHAFHGAPANVTHGKYSRDARLVSQRFPGQTPGFAINLMSSEDKAFGIALYNLRHPPGIR